MAIHAVAHAQKVLQAHIHGRGNGMDKKRIIILLAIIASCVFVFVLVTALKGRDNKVPDTTEIREANEKSTIISELEQKLSDVRTSDDSLPDMSEDEISSAVDLLHEKGMRYEEITAQDLRHANDVIPEVRTYSDEEFERMSDLERAQVGWASTIGDEPKSPLVYWVLPDKIDNGYNISIDADTESNTSRYLYDWNYAKSNYVSDSDYLLLEEQALNRISGSIYSKLSTDFNTYMSYHGLDADEILLPDEEGRFVLLRWFKFKDSDKEGWAVCYVDVVNDSNEKRTKRNCPITKVIFEI